MESQLTRADLDTLAEVFVKVWLQFHHKRISLPQPDAGHPQTAGENLRGVSPDADPI